MKGGVLSNRVAFCEQQVGEPGPWGGSVTLEVTDPGKDCGFGPVCGGRNSSRSAFGRCRVEGRPARRPGPPPSGAVSWCQQQRNGKRQDLQVRVTEVGCRAQNPARASALRDEVWRQPSPKQSAEDGWVWGDK